MKNFLLRSFPTLMTISACLAAVGCNVCEETDAKFCADLGAEDCALWKEKELNFVARAEKEGPGRRQFVQSLVFGKGSAVCQSATNDAVYPQMLKAFKDSVAALRASDAATRGVEGSAAGN